MSRLLDRDFGDNTVIVSDHWFMSDIAIGNVPNKESSFTSKNTDLFTFVLLSLLSLHRKEYFQCILMHLYLFQ